MVGVKGRTYYVLGLYLTKLIDPSIDTSMFALRSVHLLQLALACVRVEYASHIKKAVQGPQLCNKEPVERMPV